MALWLRWKKPVKSAITLDPESVDGSYDMGNNTSDSYIKVEMPINSFNRQFFEGSNTEELLQRILSISRRKWKTHKCLRVVLR